MEGNSIPIFENFAITTVVMPYYSKTDLAFLLLSRLSKRIRKKLDEFYEEFRYAMKKHSTILLLSDDTMRLLFLPCDLFKFKITLYRIDTVKIFIEFINFIYEKKDFIFVIITFISKSL